MISFPCWAEVMSNKMTISCNFLFTVYVLCKQGNDSQKAVQILRDTFSRNFTKPSSSREGSRESSSKQETPDTSKTSVCDVVIKDIAGGLHAWTKFIDKGFPVY